MRKVTNVLTGCVLLSLLVTGCGGSDSSGSNRSNAEEKTFTLTLTSVEVAKTADGTPVNLEPDGVSSGGTVTIR